MNKIFPWKFINRMYIKRVPAGTRVQKIVFFSFIEKIFTYMLVYEVRWRLKLDKKYFKIDENISSEQIYALLDNVDSDNEE